MRARLTRRTALASLATAIPWAMVRSAGAQMRALTPPEIADAAAVGRAEEVGAPVLFLGNSFTYEHDIPVLVAAEAAAAGITIRPAMLAEGGARLAGTLQISGVTKVIAEPRWAGVVAQDHSTTALDPDFAMANRVALADIAALAAPAPLVIVTPWSRAPGHPLYSRAVGLRAGALRPATPVEMTAATARHFDAVAEALSRDHPVALAPVAQAWQAAMEAGETPHRADRYHASAAGAALTARVIWQTLAPLLAAGPVQVSVPAE